LFPPFVYFIFSVLFAPFCNKWFHSLAFSCFDLLRLISTFYGKIKIPKRRKPAAQTPFSTC